MSSSIKKRASTKDNNDINNSNNNNKNKINLVTLEQVLDLIPGHEKRAYLEALHCCPHLVATESDPAHFLVREDYNVWAAARRLVSYWEARKEVFGKDRAFLPLLGDLSGNTGALDADDIATLASAYHVFLPRDSEGRPVVCMDIARGEENLGRPLTAQSMARTSFYLRSLIQHESIVQKDGYVAFCVYSEAYLRVKATPEFQRLVGILLNTLPVRTKAVFVAKLQRFTFFQKVSPLVSSYFSKGLQYRMIAVTSENEEELLRKLQAYHFTKEGLPPSLGGTWKYSDWDALWLALQQQQSQHGQQLESSTAVEKSSELEAYLESYSSGHHERGDSSSAASGSTTSTSPSAAITTTTTTSMTTVMADFYEALDMVPFDQKTAYLEAMEQCPALIEEESHPQWFLRSQNWNPWAAARRLTKYWELRLQFFGPQLAFLPLLTTCDGSNNNSDSQRTTALGADVIASLTPADDDTGAVMRIVPNGDAQGRPVLWYDRSQQPPLSKSSRFHFWWYCLSVVLELEAAHLHGCKLMIIYSSEYFQQSILAGMAEKLKTVVKTAMPIRHFDVQIVCRPPEPSESTESKNKDGSTSSDKNDMVSLSLLVDRYGHDVKVHLASSRQEMLQKLTAAGFCADGIPTEFGGTWTAQHDKAWREARLWKEWKRQEICCASSASKQRAVGSNSGKSASAAKHHRKKRKHHHPAGSSSPTLANLSSAMSEPNSNGNSIMEERLKELQQAIENMVPEKKADYLYALKNVPHLVESESNPKLFLSLLQGQPQVQPHPDNDNNNVMAATSTAADVAHAAAHRLVTYWTRRRQVFGERAFMPMTLKDDGGSSSMTSQDVAALQQGMVMSLPQDAQGTSVLWMTSDCCNESHDGQQELKRKPAMTKEVRLRVLFYMLHVICQNPNTQQSGLVMLQHGLCEETRNDLREFDDLVQQAFPARLAAGHLLFVTSSNSNSSSESTSLSVVQQSLHVMIPAAMQGLSQSFVDNTFIHVVPSKDEMQSRLEWFGFAKQDLPTAVGGTLDLDKYLPTWVCEQQSLTETVVSTAAAAAAAAAARTVETTNSSNNDRQEGGGGGSSSPIHCVSFDELNAAIDMLPAADKKAYLEAKAKDPSLIEKESNPAWYLRYKKYNIWAASHCLTAYWTKRKQVFGDRAFLPMNMTGEGAVSKEAMGYLSTGAIVFLPEDSKGRPVLYYDSSRTGETGLDIQLETLFYLSFLCSQNNASSSEGVVIILSMSQKTDQLPEMLEVVQAFPFDWHAVHMISSKSAQTKSFLEKIVPWAMKVLGSQLLSDKAVIHQSTSPNEIIEKLQGHGLVKAGLPESLGGTWSYAQHAVWQEQRIRLEWDLPLSGSGESMFHSSAKRRCDLTEEEKIERKRRYNVLHSRRKRERDKAAADVLKKQVDELTESKNAAAQENQRLERLLVEAEAVIVAERGQVPLASSLVSGSDGHNLHGQHSASLVTHSSFPIRGKQAMGRLQFVASPPTAKLSPQMEAINAQLPSPSFKRQTLQAPGHSFIRKQPPNPSFIHAKMNQAQQMNQRSAIQNPPSMQQQSSLINSTGSIQAQLRQAQLEQSLANQRLLQLPSQFDNSNVGLFSIQQRQNDGALQFQNFQGQPKAIDSNMSLLGLPRNPRAYGRPQNLSLGGAGNSLANPLDRQNQHETLLGEQLNIIINNNNAAALYQQQQPVSATYGMTNAKPLPSMQARQQQLRLDALMQLSQINTVSNGQEAMEISHMQERESAAMNQHTNIPTNADPSTFRLPRGPGMFQQPPG